jgi:hypothetical protein
MAVSQVKYMTTNIFKSENMKGKKGRRKSNVTKNPPFHLQKRRGKFMRPFNTADATEV